MHRANRIAWILAAIAMFSAPVQAETASATPVQGQFLTAPVITSQTGGSATVGGTVIPFKEVTLSAQVPGRVTFIAGAEGHRAETAKCWSDRRRQPVQAQRRAAVSQVYQAEAALRNSYMQYSRELYSPRVNSVTGVPGHGHPVDLRPVLHPRLLRRSSASPTAGSSARPISTPRASASTRPRAALAAAQANLEIDRRVAEGFPVGRRRSTASSWRKHVEVGDTVQPGMPLINYAFIDYLRIEADVPVRLAAGLAEGMLVPARLDAAAVQVEARVAQIYPVADPKRHTVTVKFDLPVGTPGGPGMYAEVTVPDASVPTQGQTSVPIEALVWRGSLPSVFVLEGGAPSLADRAGRLPAARWPSLRRLRSCPAARW